eukprot:CAMPEP_0197267166 /NCGR_PEP_ID=MMETSP1432-20130617/3434_1 /TAXON_ID=44447 /ORGANISM="Pseudo-nitzschia delicatissima, Strain UNC1205" /LENGTH=69 /DNA_ID=CAMNT_0042732099 /DNA_START=329 /DNA_END=535 /DNA_ORIENTATION=+
MATCKEDNHDKFDDPDDPDDDDKMLRHELGSDADSEERSSSGMEEGATTAFLAPASMPARQPFPTDEEL